MKVGYNHDRKSVFVKTHMSKIKEKKKQQSNNQFLNNYIKQIKCTKTKTLFNEIKQTIHC